MTYARARLWLGITAVGSLVVLSSLALGLGLPNRWLSAATSHSVSDGWQLAAVLLMGLVWLLPFDYLGGQWAPRRFGRLAGEDHSWWARYLTVAAAQFSVFLLVAMGLLTSGRWGGWLAAVLFAAGAMWLIDQLRTWYVLRLALSREQFLPAVSRAIDRAVVWGTRPKADVVVVEHTDEGFTGGIVWRLGRPVIVLPRLWIEQLSAESLACVLARRASAIESGAFRRGTYVAYLWNLGGLAICGLLPLAGFTSVATLVTTGLYFTIWSFIGLLWLPSVSRQAARALDQQLSETAGSRQVDGVAIDEIVRQTALQLDRWQDHEPRRGVWIERIFHPIPSAETRGSATPKSDWAAWNSARLTLAYSWGCAGLLSRAVHCNLGRPELWLILPID